MDYESAVWEFDRGALGRLHRAVPFKMVRKLQIKGQDKGGEKKGFLKRNTRCVFFKCRGLNLYRKADR